MQSISEASADDALIERAVSLGDGTVMLAALLQMTEDPELAEIKPVPMPFMGAFVTRVLAPKDDALVRRKAADLLRRVQEGSFTPPPPPPADRLAEIMSIFSEGDFPEGYVEPSLEELAVDTTLRWVKWRSKPAEDVLAGSTVVVIGAGLGGIAAAIQAKRLGLPFSVLEKNQDVGGTWCENVYPDARVDVPSHHYSYSFEVGYQWKHFFAPQPEIQDYLNETATKHGVRDHIEFGLEVFALTWNEADSEWEIRCRDAHGVETTRRARFVITAVGMLNRPKLPDIEGLADFAGTTFHTARWDPSVRLEGRRVGLLGTGATGLQLAPRLAEMAEHLTVFQRTPQWLAPMPGYRNPIPEDLLWLLGNFPFYQNWLRMKLFYTYCDGAEELYDIDPNWQGDPRVTNRRQELIRETFLAHLKEQVGDRHDLIEKNTPNYPPMSRRIVIDNGWLAALTRPNVTLVTEGVERITPGGVVGKDGKQHPLDVLLIASGFEANKFLYPMEITGRGGVKLSEQWSKDGARAYLGMTMPNFPNLFSLLGPNTFPKSGSIFLWDEVHARYVLDCIRVTLEHANERIEVRQDVHDDYNAHMDQRLTTSIWTDPRANSYYRNEFGRCGVTMPWMADEYWGMTKAMKPDDYKLG